MSFQITTAFVQQYSSTMTHLVQQRGSRLRGTVMVDSGVVGKRAFYDQIGSVTAQTPVSRHADTPLISTPHSRRVVDLIDKNWADLVDRDDMVRTLVDPTNKYTQAGAFALGRAIDAEVIRAMDNDALTGEIGDVTETVTAATAVAGGTSVALADLITARGTLRAAEAIVDGEPLFCVCSSATIDDLLGQATIQSIDQNTYRALAGGEVTTFMGFTFIQTELVGGIGGATEILYFYPKSAVTLAIGRDINHSIDRRPDKCNSVQVYSHMTIGATRMEQSKVFRMSVDHS